MTVLSERNTRMGGYMPHAMSTDPPEVRRIIRREIQLQHDTRGWAGDIIKFDPSVDGVEV